MASCSHYKSAPSSDTSGNGSGYQSAQSAGANTYGVGGNAGYQTTGTGKTSLARTTTNGQHANSLTAPSNQTYYFTFNSNQVNTSDVAAMTQQANYLATHPNASIRLEGNTDNRGSREYNVGLGWRRDQSVDHFFTQRGVSRKQIKMVSYGKEHPVAFGNDPKDWALNRRVNLFYKAG
ncbi:MAG: peptidoglycan-binding protein [Coxiella sp. (in: Bacteria)]|nr:MAG: peptidoglycan-binding protein [Coxiella sp. (in: g-proteobacteria)]